MNSILFEEITDKKHSIVIKRDFIAHIAMEDSLDDHKDNQLNIQSTNSFKVFMRGVLEENLKSEMVLHKILKTSGVEHKTLFIYLFEEIDNISLLQLLCDYINYVCHRKLSLKIDQDHFTIFDDQSVIIRSFIC